MSLFYPLDSQYKTITSEYGSRTAPTTNASTYHYGIDISVPSGSKVYSAVTGTVTKVGYNNYSGNYVEVTDNNGLQTIYKHLSSALVKLGESVTAGQNIALSGNTGVSTGAHLHFETILNGEEVNPVTLLYDNTSTTETDSSSALSSIKNKLEDITSNIDTSGIVETIKDNYIIVIAALLAFAFILPNSHKE